MAGIRLRICRLAGPYRLSIITLIMLSVCYADKRSPSDVFIKLKYIRLSLADNSHSHVCPIRVFRLRWNSWLSPTATIQHQPLPLLPVLRMDELLFVSVLMFLYSQCAQAQGSSTLLFTYIDPVQIGLPILSLTEQLSNPISH